MESKTSVVTRFVVGGRYRNLRGEYVVKAINPETLDVEYEGGEKAVLTKKVQERILQNQEFNAKIEAQIEAEEKAATTVDNSPILKDLPDFVRSTRLKFMSAFASMVESPKPAHLDAWQEKVQTMSLDEIKAEIARLEAMQ